MISSSVPFEITKPYWNADCPYREISEAGMGTPGVKEV